METTPDLTHFFAIHRKMRIDMRRYVRALEMAREKDRGGRLVPLSRWARGFAHELTEHHWVEDEIFFPHMRQRVPAVGAIIDGLEADHHLVDGLLARWPVAAANLVDSRITFVEARDEALEVAVELRDLLETHLAIEDDDILPLYWQHYTAAEFDALHQQAVKDGKKTGLGFVLPWNMACLDATAQKALLATAPLPLKVIWWATRGRFERLEREAFGGINVDTSDLRTVQDLVSAH